jgi:hypothetical protein
VQIAHATRVQPLPTPALSQMPPDVLFSCAVMLAGNAMAASRTYRHERSDGMALLGYDRLRNASCHRVRRITVETKAQLAFLDRTFNRAGSDDTRVSPPVAWRQSVRTADLVGGDAKEDLRLCGVFQVLQFMDATNIRTLQAFGAPRQQSCKRM